ARQALRSDAGPVPTIVPVDPERRLVPVASAGVRADVHAHRSFLSPLVYRSFVERVCLLGGECSGKTTLARRLARRFDTTWVREYGRELWESRAGALAEPDLRRIAQTQVAREDEAALAARRYLVCDT